MKFRVRHVVSHYAIDGVESRSYAYGHYYVSADPRLSFDARSFWDSSGLETECSGGVVAWRNGRVVGFCRYNHCYDSLMEAEEISMAGTWVDPRYRRHGLALRMWRVVMRRLSSSTDVYAMAVSKEGEQLIRGLAKRYVQFNFFVDVNYGTPSYWERRAVA